MLRFFKIKIILITLLALLLIAITSSFWAKKNPKEVKIYRINIAKIVIPIKNLIMLRDVDDRINLLKSSYDCRFCNFTNGDFKSKDLKGVDLRYANFNGANLSNVNFNGAKINFANFSNANLSGVDFGNMNLSGVVFTNANLSRANLDGVNLINVDFSGANLSETNLINKDMTGVNLDRVNLSNKDLSSVNLSGVDLSNKGLTGTILKNANLSRANLDGVVLSNKDLSGVNLSGVDLSNKDLTGTILKNANLSRANLDGVVLSNKDLSGVNLSGVDLSNIDLTGANLEKAIQVEIRVKNPNNSNWPALNEVKNLSVTSYDLSENIQYLSTKEGFLFESKNGVSKLVLDLNNDSLFTFYLKEPETGFFSVVSKNNFVYISYSSVDNNGLVSLVVDEYSMNFSKVRNIIKIDGFDAPPPREPAHFAGNLKFDSNGSLYLSVGDAFTFETPQDLNDYRGKILRLDISNLKSDPEIIAYGVRNPWGTYIDKKDRMFIMQCGQYNVEALYLLNDLYPNKPLNIGWPVYEGSRISNQLMYILSRPENYNPSLVKDDLLAPIFETSRRPGCLTAGIYLDDLDLLLFADFYGTIRLLKQKENGDWYLFHQYKQDNFIWGLGIDKVSNKIFIAPNNLELEISVNAVKLDT